jgi:hypothetical protein
MIPILALFAQILFVCAFAEADFDTLVSRAEVAPPGESVKLISTFA